MVWGAAVRRRRRAVGGCRAILGLGHGFSVAHARLPGDFQGARVGPLAPRVDSSRGHPGAKGPPLRGAAQLGAGVLARPRGRLAGPREREFVAAEHSELVRPSAAGAIAELTGEPIEACERALAGAWMAPAIADDPAPWWPREALARLVGGLASLTGPRTVVEIGVARGYSSAAILAALHEAGDGRLYSIDLPPLDEHAAAFVGSVVPEHLRAHWRLELGPSAAHLPRLATEVAPIDLLVHDGDHSYLSQRDDLGRRSGRTLPPVR